MSHAVVSSYSLAPARKRKNFCFEKPAAAFCGISCPHPNNDPPPPPMSSPWALIVRTRTLDLTDTLLEHQELRIVLFSHFRPHFFLYKRWKLCRVVEEDERMLWITLFIVYMPLFLRRFISVPTMWSTHLKVIWRSRPMERFLRCINPKRYMSLIILPSPLSKKKKTSLSHNTKMRIAIFSGLCSVQR